METTYHGARREDKAQLMQLHTLDGDERDGVIYLVARLMLNCAEEWMSFPYAFRYRVVHSCVVAYRMHGR